MTLPDNPTREQILAHINTYKVKALNLASSKLFHTDADLLEPRELKSLTDMVLNIEDSIKQEVPEGQQARTIQRLLDKYATDDYTDLATPHPQPLTLEHDHEQ